MRLRNQTNAKIVVFAPYLLECENREAQRADLERLLPIMSSYANLFSDVYIPTDRLFEEALKVQPYPKFYSRDGVHPNDEGAKFIGKRCKKAYGIGGLAKKSCEILSMGNLIETE